MRRFEWMVLLLLSFTFMAGFGGCEKKDWRVPEKMHWDRDMCERCKMAVSDRNYAVEVVDPKTHKHYKFDDIGCALLWFKENGYGWMKDAVIWVNDAKTGEWIDAKKAYYTTGNVTPMGFGFAAYKSPDEAGGKETIGFDEVIERVLKRGR
ncbi:nitrous oxide reductase maturation protein, outer-membrane lipoprotein NosL [Hydrogenimonas sp.]|nr:nitrous oxide reductase maturation protein, outer-membrane lipoprotein NosL [Hydrogenimonas sp.]